MAEADLAVGAAAALNLIVAVAGALWSPLHHRALASMLGVTWLNRRPLFKGEGRLRRGFRAATGTGLFALREIVFTVALVLAATFAASAITAWALLAAQASHAATVSVSGTPVVDVTDMVAALVGHTVASRSPDVAVFFALPPTVVTGNGWTQALMLSFALVVTSAGLRAVAELAKVLWFASVCFLFPVAARKALEERQGWARRALAIPASS